jgi:dTDP-4-amino-4,6-dideoxygalactose transaminase
MIPFSDLPAQYRSLRHELEPAVLSVLESGHYVLGREVASFEQDFARYVDARHAVAVNSGTSALHLALLSAGVGPGDEVITVPLTFVATAAAIRYTGARPRFVDVDPGTLTMDPDRLGGAITAKTKAVIPVHLYGQPADMDPIVEIAHAHRLTVIEDACQAHGARYKGRPVGSIGEFGCFSFYPGKNLGACGEGGLVTARDQEADRMLRMLRDWGAERKYQHEYLGFNYRMDGIQGAALRVKLRRLDAWNRRRRELAARYDAQLKNIPIGRVERASYGDHVYHLYVIRVQERDQLQSLLHEAGIQTGIHYPVPVHLQPWASSLGYRPGDFPEAEQAAASVLSLPLYPEMPEAHVDEVAAALQRLVSGQHRLPLEVHAAGY